MKVWVAKQDIDKYKKGDVICTAVTWTSWLKSYCKEYDVGDIDSVDSIHLIKTTLPNGEFSFDLDMTAKLQKECESKITEAYNTMNMNVLAEMKKTFGTTKSDSALANELTWKEMARAGTPYASLGLVSDLAFAEFEIGDKLDTATKIKSWANEKIKMTRKYSVFRIKEINKFKLAKQALLSEYGL